MTHTRDFALWYYDGHGESLVDSESIVAIAMLRSRKKLELAGRIISHSKSVSTSPMSKPNLGPPTHTGLHHTVYRNVIRYYQSILLSTFLLLMLCVALRFSPLSFNGLTTRIQNSVRINTGVQSSMVIEGHTNRTFQSIGLSSRKPFLVDRSILEKLDRIQKATDPDEREYSIDPNHARAKFHWPPSVTRIPEPKFTHVGSLPPNTPHREICGTSQSSPCRFLLPLRIAEQESKARIHFLQLIQLAGELDRTLVLPNVGKSRLGTCFRWDFETYYDLERLVEGLYNKRAHIAKMDAFKWWVETRPDLTTAQIVSITSKQAGHIPLQNTHSFLNLDIVIEVDDFFDTQDLKLPSCFKAKFLRLGLDLFSPLFIHPADLGQETPKNKLIGNLLIDALSRNDIRTAALRPNASWDDFRLQEQEFGSPQQPDVLLVNWDLRHPIFPESSLSSLSPTLYYSPNLVSLAKKLSPSHAYLVIHWRMETVPPEVLPECANSLIDKLSNLLREEALADEIQTVWLATDYPYPFSGAPLSIQPEQIMKSGTFKNVREQHVEAMDILKAAFEGGGELEEWKLTGLTEALEQARKDDGIEEEMLTDSGVLGILDKIIAMRATLFVSGAKGCSRARYVVCRPQIILHSLPSPY